MGQSKQNKPQQKSTKGKQSFVKDSRSNSNALPNGMILSKQHPVIKLLVTLLPILVAVGAYSRDSIFVQLLTSKSTYSVVRGTAIGGKENTGFYRAYATPLGTLLAPIQMFLYLHIRNDSDFDQIIEGLLVEVQDEDKTWEPVNSLMIGYGIYSARSIEGLKESTLLDFNEENLVDNLGKGKIHSKDVVSGWLFLEFPREFREQNAMRQTLKITLFSGFGEQETHLIQPAILHNDATQTNAASFGATKIKKDLSNLKVLAEKDYDRLNKQKK